MEELLGFIAPILAIVFWLVGMSKSGDEEKKQQNPPQRQRNPAQRPARRTQETTAQTIGKTDTASIPVETRRKTPVSDKMQETFEQQKEKQIQAIEEQLQQAESIRNQTTEQPIGEHDAIKDKPKQKAYRKNKDNDISVSISDNLTKKGIAQGIIMAEVLGPPRAYQKKYHHRKY